ncbi:MAG: TIGR00269 family protein, partial [Thaumarchaeota archaeon]
MKCDKCENQAAYTRKYSGQKLCSQCFSNSIIRKTAKTISKYNMIKYD